MSIAVGRPVATFDEFLEDPLILAELEAVIERLGQDTSALPETVGGSLKGIESVRVKARQWAGKRERLNDRDAATLILRAWRSYRP